MRAAPSYHVVLVVLNAVGIAGQQSGDHVDADVAVRAEDTAPAASRPTSILRREKVDRPDRNSNALKMKPSLTTDASERHIHNKLALETIVDSESHVSQRKKKAASRQRAKQSKGLARHKSLSSHDSRVHTDEKPIDDDEEEDDYEEDKLGYIYRDDVNHRRRRTKGQEWDCGFHANWMTAPNVAPSFVKSFDATHSVQEVEMKCRETCEDMQITCTGYDVYEDGKVPGEGMTHCEVFTVDLTIATRYMKHNTADGKVCLHVGKNFHCSDNANMVKTPPDEMRNDFKMEYVPEEVLQINGETYPLALSWCKRTCISREVNCQTFWLQEQTSASKVSYLCGMYANEVTEDDREMSDDASITAGCICDAY